MSRFSKSIGDNNKGRSILTRRIWDELSVIEISAKSPLIIELMK
jgi:hypothetical protein